LKTSTWRLFPPQHTEIDKGHGRLETRRIWTSTELVGYSDFPYLAQVFRIYRHCFDLIEGTEQSEVAFGLTSLTPRQANPARAPAYNRQHWGIENKVHYVRDVTFGEDLSRVRKKAGPHVMASLRHPAIGVFRLAAADNIAEAVRSCTWNFTRTLRLVGIVMA
jgi:hypothetical protein